MQTIRSFFKKRWEKRRERLVRRLVIEDREQSFRRKKGGAYYA